MVILLWARDHCYYQLFQNGNTIYNALNSTNIIIHRENSTIDHHQRSVPLIMHRMWKDDHILDDNNDNGLPLNWTKEFTYCNKVYQKRHWMTILWDDKSIRAFLERNYPYFLPAYDSYPYNIQRVDSARYFILYHYGGVYMDLDVGCKSSKDLSDFVRTMEQMNKTALLPLTEPVGFSNDILIATKSSPFFKALIQSLPHKNKWYGSPYLTVMYGTGPMFVSLVYTRLSSGQQHEVLALAPD